MSPDAVVRALRRDGASFSGLLGLLAVMAVVFAFLLPQRFPTLGTVQSMAFQMPELGILALAMAVPLISGGLNLAIIATANLSALVMAFTIKALLGVEPSAMWTAVALLLTVGAGMLVCLAIGLLNGFITAYVGVHPILVTLGTKTLVDGIAIWWTRGRVISGFPPEIIWLGNATVLSIPVPMLVFGLCAALVGILMTRTPWGQRVYMIGSNEKATRFSGVDTRRVLMGVYVLSSCLCCVAALLMMARFNSARVGYAESYLLVTILAAVLGGIDPFGGFGRILGLVLGLCVLQVISSGFNLLGFSQHLTLAIWGLTLIGVLALGSVRQRWSARR